MIVFRDGKKQINVRLTDFKLATIHPYRSLQDMNLRSKVDSEIAHLAPEITDGDVYNTKSDVWSVMSLIC